MELEADQYQGLSRWDSGKMDKTNNTDVIVVKSYDVYHSPGTIDEINQLFYNYSGTKVGSYVPSVPTPPLSPLWNPYSDFQNHSSYMMANTLRRWRILKVIAVYFPGLRHELARNAGKKEICGEVFADEVHLCNALNTLGDDDQHIVDVNVHHG